MKITSILGVIILLFAIACNNHNPNLNDTGEDELKSLELDRKLDKQKMTYEDVVYVPIYSDIYIDEGKPKNLLSATLSIRNTSYRDSLFVSKIDYFNTDGDLVRSYIENTISLPPMGTINYVVEREDDMGGPGANFIVKLFGKNSSINPLVQAVMIGHSGNIGFSFSTDGYSIGIPSDK